MYNLYYSYSSSASYESEISTTATKMNAPLFSIYPPLGKQIKVLKKELDEKKVVKMIIGTDDFLMNEIHSEFADAIVDEFSSVGKVLNDWHAKGLRDIEFKDQDRKIDNLAQTIPQDVRDLFEVVVPDEENGGEEEKGGNLFPPF